MKIQDKNHIGSGYNCNYQAGSPICAASARHVLSLKVD